jgi:hypothetical protein
VINGSWFAIEKAVAYITIEHNNGHISDNHAGHSPLMAKSDNPRLNQGQLCWSALEAGKNPMRIDIYPGESQPLMIAKVLKDDIEIASELAFEPPRVRLRPNDYKGTLKLVAKDFQAMEFEFRFCLGENSKIEILRSLEQCSCPS